MHDFQVPAQVERLENRRLMSTNLSEGVNLEGISDWTSSVFTNAFNQARPWMTRNADGSGDWQTGLSSSIPVDSNGYPTKVPFVPASGGTAQIVHTVIPVRGAGTYKIIVTGKGSLRFSAFDGLLDPTTSNGVSKTYTFVGGKNTSDLMVYKGGQTTSPGQVYVEILSSDAADPIRDIDVVLPGYENTYLNQPFLPSWTQNLKTFSNLRFMDWISTNSNDLTSWNQRTTLNSYTQASNKGVALELIVALANQLGKDAWITIPTKANDEYVRNTAKYLRDNLNPSLKLYVEYSNETWNWMFSQTSYVMDQGQRLQLDADSWVGGQKYVAYRSAQIWDLFQQELGSSSADRLVKVMASQAASTSVTSIRMGALTNTTINPKKITADVLAIAPYFGNGVANSLASQNLSTVTVDTVIAMARAEMLRDSASWVRDQKTLADKYGVWLVNYEAGQHLVGYNGVENNATLTNLLIAANRSSQMYNLYTEYNNMLSANGVVLNENFSYVNSYSKYGSWGILEHQDQAISAAPKLQSIVDWSTANPTANLVPVARAGDDISVFAGTNGTGQATLDSGRSRDLDGKITSVEWRLKNGQLLGTQPTLPVTLPIGRYEIVLTIKDNDGAISTDQVILTVAPETARSTLVNSSFSGVSPSLNTPWNKTTSIDPNIAFTGWTVGPGLRGYAVDNRFGFYGDYGGSVETTLSEAISTQRYLSMSVKANTGYTLDLRGAKVTFSIDRIDAHSARQYVVMSSVNGFTSSAILFDSGRIETEGTVTFSFDLPTSGFDKLQNVEFRIYAAAGKYFGHKAAVSSFSMNGQAVASRKAISVRPIIEWNVAAGALSPTATSLVRSRITGYLKTTSSLFSLLTISGDGNTAAPAVANPSNALAASAYPVKAQ